MEWFYHVTRCSVTKVKGLLCTQSNVYASLESLRRNRQSLQLIACRRYRPPCNCLIWARRAIQGYFRLVLWPSLRYFLNNPYLSGLIYQTFVRTVTVLQNLNQRKQFLFLKHVYFNVSLRLTYITQFIVKSFGYINYL